MIVFTVGHSTRSTGDLVGLLDEVGIDLLVDVRSLPRSRRNPQFNADALAPALLSAGIAYRHLPALGGLRGRQPGDAAGATDDRARAGSPPRRSSGPRPTSPNGYWTVAGFRHYADYAQTPAFRAGFDALVSLAHGHRPVLMCAEALWWRCHRRIIADYLLAAGAEVVHILGPGKAEPARLTEQAVVGTDGAIVYPAAQSSLF